MDLTFAGFISDHMSIFIFIFIGCQISAPRSVFGEFFGAQISDPTGGSSYIYVHTIFLEINILNLLTLLSFDTVDGQNPAPPGMVLKPVVNNGYFQLPFPQLVSLPDF